MPNISGLVSYNASHLASPGIAMPGIPVALYSITTGKGAVAITDASGNYLFTNVPADNYYIIETWGTPGAPSPIDFTTTQVAMSQPPEVEPPLSALAFTPPALADALDAITPNLIKVTVTTNDIQNNNFFDGPVGIKPLDFSGVILTGSNLITVADNGTMGSFPPGTAQFTTNPTEPYPGVTPGLIYSTSPDPGDGQYTVMNTRTSVSKYPWWGISDHTTGIETGRYLLINGANTGASIFTQTVAVTPNTDYVLTAWVLNLIYKTTGYVNPELALEVLAPNGDIIYFKCVNPIEATEIPVWYQEGFKFNSDGHNSVTIRILSEGEAATGNDYVIDDVTMYRATVETLISVNKTASPAIIYNGTDVKMSVTVSNNSTIDAHNVIFKDILDPTLTFVSGSVTVDSIPNLTADPNTGFLLGDMPAATSHVVVFHAISKTGPSPVPNTANATYNVFSSGNGDIVTQMVNSNTVLLHRPLYNFGQESTDIVESVALEQTALSHIINAEGEKIQAMLAIEGITAEQLLAVNASVDKMLNSITQLEGILAQKLETVENQVVSCNNI